MGEEGALCCGFEGGRVEVEEVGCEGGGEVGHDGGVSGSRW